jgi:uncharacterized membrane-anchored protein
MEAPGLIRFVPAGFIDSNAALAWSPNDILASLNDTMERGNPQRVERGLPELEARRWVLPPHYDPETRQISWAALILPKSAPRESDGEVTYQAIGFGRQGYMQITVVSSMQKADQIGHMLEAFLGGLVFRPGTIYDDALPTDRTAPAGLPGAMGIDAFRKWRAPGNFLASDTVVPVAGAIVATIGALSLIIYIRRQQRRQARRG